jgi:hypothetical protein
MGEVQKNASFSSIRQDFKGRSTIFFSTLPNTDPFP